MSNQPDHHRTNAPGYFALGEYRSRPNGDNFSRDNAELLALNVPGRDEPIGQTHCSFGQMCSLVGAPAGYVGQHLAPLAGIKMQHGLLSYRVVLAKTLEADDGRIELRGHRPEL